MSDSSPQRVLPLLTSLLLFLTTPGGAVGQEEVIPFLRGEARLGPNPLSDGVVVLHRITDQASGEIDSVRVASDGSFRLRLPHVPDHAARLEIFFGSIEFGGLNYFGPAITEAFQLDSLYLIQVYDTVSVPPEGAQLPLTARNVYLEPGEGGWAVTDVYQLRVEGERTLYSPEEGVVWSYPLPEGARDPQVGQGDMAPEAVRFNGGRVEVFSPLPPGERYLMIGYSLSDPSTSFPMPGRTDHMEVLVREPAPAAEFPPLSLTDPMEMEPGATFRRYVGSDFLDEVIRGEMAAEPWSLPAEWLGLLMAALLGGAGVFGYRRRGTAATEASASPGGAQRREDLASAAKFDREAVLVSIAALDENYHASGDSSEAARAEYQEERKRLLSLLKRLS